MGGITSHPCHALRIAHTWNGLPLSQAEIIRMELEWRPNGLLIDFEAPFYADPPPSHPPGPCPQLWEHEVVEVFVAHEQRYTEIELAPGGQYLLLRLDGVRQIVSQGHLIRYRVYPSPGRWQGTALIPPELLPPRPWRYNAFAIHGQGITRRYAACFPVPGDQPDFHRLQHFAPLEFAD